MDSGESKQSAASLSATTTLIKSSAWNVMKESLPSCDSDEDDLLQHLANVHDILFLESITTIEANDARISRKPNKPNSSSVDAVVLEDNGFSLLSSSG